MAAFCLVFHALLELAREGGKDLAPVRRLYPSVPLLIPCPFAAQASLGLPMFAAIFALVFWSSLLANGKPLNRGSHPRVGNASIAGGPLGRAEGCRMTALRTEG